MNVFKIILIIFLLIYQTGFTKTLWNEKNSIYSTKHNYKAGDTLKIIFNEKSIVNYQLAVKETGKAVSTTKAGQGTSIQFLPDLSIGNNFETSLKSSTKNKGLLSKSITAKVNKILNNGNMEISGTHSIKINDTLEQVSIQGIVNPIVIKNKKIVYSTDIINPSIIYKSKIEKPEIIFSKDYIKTFSTNISVVSGKTQFKVTSKYEISEQKKNELIKKYLNKILSILFKK